MAKWAAILAGCVLYAMPLCASSVYLADSDNEFGTLNLTTGVFTPIGTVSVPVGQNIYGMGFTSGGTLYGTDSSPFANVYTINPGNGATTQVGSASNSSNGSTVGSNGLIYGVSQDTSAVFFTINPSTLATNTINGSLGFTSDGLATFDNGEFYTSLSTVSDLLEEIDPTTGVVTQIGTGLGFNALAGTLVGNTLYAVGLVSNTVPVLETIDTSTGTGTLVADITGISGIPDALAYNNNSSAVPEPAAGWLGGFGVLALVVIGRRRLGFRQ